MPSMNIMPVIAEVETDKEEENKEKVRTDECLNVQEFDQGPVVDCTIALKNATIMVSHPTNQPHTTTTTRMTTISSVALESA